MQNLQDLQDKILLETKNILFTLSQSDSVHELLSKQESIDEIKDRISFLKILTLNKEYLMGSKMPEISPDNSLNSDAIFNVKETVEKHSPQNESAPEEFQFTTEINSIAEEMISENISSEALADADIQNMVQEIEYDFDSAENDQDEVNVKALIDEQAESSYEERILQKEKEFLESEERRRTIVEFNKQDMPQSVVTEPFETEVNEHILTERKFKLANIKGLKAVQNLFDEDPLEKIQEENFHLIDKSHESGSILKTNISTDFMEAEKKKPEFRLDFNDKIAFTKVLFKGNDEELKVTIDKLNSFDNLEDAKQYLSEVYYVKDWQKADEYAQRLWGLVENKFL